MRFCYFYYEIEDFINFPSFKEATDAYQREFILHKLGESGGNVSKAAESMGVDRSHLYRRMKNLGINAERLKGE